MGITDIFFPKNCIGCSNAGSYICTACIKRVEIVSQVCPYCQKASVDGVTHSKCLKKFRMDGAYSIWLYEKVVRKAILKMKYKFATEIASELSEYMIQILRDQAIFPKNSVLLPVPLYWFRHNFRGFNQSELIGKILADKMNRGFNSEILVRKRLNRPQTELKGKERRENIKGVFAVSPNILRSKIEFISQYPNIIIFDDVYTTGSTLKEAAIVLKRNGAKKVWGLTIAR